MSRNKKTDEKSRGRHAMPEENNKKNNDKQVKQKQPNMRIKKQEPVKAKKKVKTRVLNTFYHSKIKKALVMLYFFIKFSKKMLRKFFVSVIIFLEVYK